LAISYCFAQSSFRSKYIVLLADTTRLDTLSIIPGKVTLKERNGVMMDSSKYKIDCVNALLILAPRNTSKGKDSLLISYSVFPYYFSKTYQHKDIRRIQNNQYGEPYTYIIDKNKDVDFFKTEGLSKSGSISRGISFGNKQDVVLNSNLNLQLAGKLNDNMDILLAATDQNIPIQPEGNTQQLQEFDKIFIQIGLKELPLKGKTTITAGDFQIGKPAGYFMNFNKKLQGLGVETGVQNLKSVSMTAKAHMAVSKGKFAKNASLESSDGNTFNAQKQERNQGPYKLHGAENEQYIIVLAGTETVYLEGKLLERGQEHDYVIDYNMAEIIFTPKNIITKDKRIIVEFQYSDKNYARSLLHAGTEYGTKWVKARINIYSEQDNKNHPLQQKLETPQKFLLATIGDSLQQAITLSADSVAFNNTEALYHKMDSTKGSFSFRGIYVYSTDSSKAHYRITFSYVGANKGNYIVQPSSANSKVYQWVMPDTLTHRLNGSYEPVTLLITPKQKQMVAAGADFILSKNSRLNIEGAASNYNINTFSDRDKINDKGFAGKLNWDSKTILSRFSSSSSLSGAEADSLPSSRNPSSESNPKRSPKPQEAYFTLLTNINYEYVQKTFSPIERFREVEFERNWNLVNTLQSGDQHIFGGKIGLAKRDNLILYDYNSFLEGGFYQGTRHGANINLGTNGFILSSANSYLTSKNQIHNTRFLRHNASLSKEFKIQNSKFKLGIREQQEQNLIKEQFTDLLTTGSVRFAEMEPYLEFKDSANNRYTVNYKQRTDYALKIPGKPTLYKSTYAETFGAGIELMSHTSSQFRITGSYRSLKILDTTLTIQKPENTAIGRMEYNFSLCKGFFSSNSFYEVGSGLELKKAFIFLEVAPGQGVFVWNKDYNGNGIKDLNEFEVSPFPNEANYIKVWIPTDEYISTYTNQFSEVFSIKPAATWNNKKRIQKIASRFMNQTAYRTDRKTTNHDLAVAYNPFLSDTRDNTLVTLNSSLRNTLYFNQADAVFGMDFTWQDVRNKTLLVNDTTYRVQTTRETKAHWNLNRQWTIQCAYKNGIKQNNSRFFPTRNYNIVYFEIEPQINFQSTASFRTALTYKYSEKENTLVTGSNPYAKATSQNFGGELKYNALNKGSLTMKLNFILITFNDAENSPLSYEMLEGLSTGKNYTWGVGYNRTLANNIQLTLSYDGRQSPRVKTIHTANVQVRAYF
jgi:hypothetical protein